MKEKYNKVVNMNYGELAGGFVIILGTFFYLFCYLNVDKPVNSLSVEETIGTILVIIGMIIGIFLLFKSTTERKVYWEKIEEDIK